MVSLYPHPAYSSWLPEARLMRGPQPPLINLTLRQRGVLEQLDHRRSAPHHLVTRARLILHAAAGHNNSHIAAALQLDPGRVQTSRARSPAAAPAPAVA